MDEIKNSDIQKSMEAVCNAVPNSDRDWPEDFDHENGNYECKCLTCGNMFRGHKRRVICKVCSANVKLSLVKSEYVENVQCKSVPVSDRDSVIQTAISQMITIMINKGGVGLAASQVGINAKFFIARLPSLSPEPTDTRRIAVIFDPEYRGNGKKRNSDEGCLTYPKRVYRVKRYKTIKVKYTNHLGQELTAKLRGEDALVFQHETDHCGQNGELGQTIKEFQI